MPSVVLVGVFNTNTPQQNAGSFVGEFNLGGWDANIKMNQGIGSLFGFFNFLPGHINVNLDNLEVFDGVINDQDFKPLGGTNI